MRRAAEASRRTLAGIAALSAEPASVIDAAGRVLAESVHAALTLPPWANSAMDGYAVRAEDVATATDGAPVHLRVLETVAAGAFPTRALERGAATRIMTGAPVPDGADTVIRVEDTDGGDTTVVVRDARDAGRNVRPAGEDVRAGDLVLDAGTWLGGAQIGILAAAGIPAVRVHRRPRVGIITSGDELVTLDQLDEALAGRRIISSNGYALAALARAAGADVVDFGIVGDSVDALRERLARAASDCDLVVTTAGVSVGAFDFTRQAFEALGGTIDFWKVRMRPGAQLGSGHAAGTPWLGLPGNPVSAVVTFELFARPMIRRMLGHTRIHLRATDCVLGEPMRTAGGAIHLLRVRLGEGEGSMPVARLAGPQGSNIQRGLALADALLVVPAEGGEQPAGRVLRAVPLGERMTFGEDFPF